MNQKATLKKFRRSQAVKYTAKHSMHSTPNISETVQASNRDVVATDH